MRRRWVFQGDRLWDRSAREGRKTPGSECAGGREAKWEPARGPRTTGKGDKRGHKTEMRGAEEEIGRGM